MSKNQPLLVVWWPSHAEQTAQEDAGRLPQLRYAVCGTQGQLLNSGQDSSQRLPKDLPCLVLLAPSDITLLSVQLPPLSGKKLKDALPYVVETQLLNEPEENHVSAWHKLADHPQGEHLVAVVSKSRMRAVMSGCKAAGLAVTAVSSEGLLPVPAGASWVWLSGPSTLWCVDAARAPAAIDLGQTGLAQAMLMKRFAQCPGGVWMREVDRQRLSKLPDAQAPGLGRLLELCAPSRNLRDPALNWSVLVQRSVVDAAELRKQGLRHQATGHSGLQSLTKPALVLAITTLVGMNAWAWKMQRDEQSLEQHIEQTYAQALPNTPMVADPLLLLEREMKNLTSGTRSANAESVSHVLHEVGLALEAAPFNSLQQVQYNPGKLLLKLSGNVDEKTRAEALQRLKAKQLVARWNSGESGQGPTLEVEWGANK